MYKKIGYYFIATDITNRRAHTLQIFKTVEAINSSGAASVTLVAPKLKYDDNLVDVFNYYKVRQHFTIKFLPKIFKKSLLGALAFNVFAALFLFRLKLQNRVDFIYFRSHYFAPLTFWAWLLRLPYFYELHRQGLSALEQKVKENLVKRAKGVVVIADELKERFEVFNKNIVVARDGVDLKRFDIDTPKEEARVQIGLANQNNLIVYVGSIKKIKGVDLLLETAKMVPEAKFVFAGRIYDGLDKNTPENVRFVGEVDNSVVPLYLKAADILVIPHPDNQQSMSPMKLFEYMASNRPIVASDIPVIREVLNKTNAVLVPSREPSKWSEALRILLKDQGLATTIAEQAHTDSKFYTWQARASEIISCLER